VELFDGDERLDLFRILPNTARRSADGLTITYSCEHVLGTLLDDILFQFHTVGNLGVYTADVLNYILQRQTVQRWQLGNVGFDRQFEYTWENETLLGALFSVPKPFVEEFMWTWDTSSFPWTLNLVAPPALVEAYIRYGVNMQGIEKTVDPSNICTRLYCLGYGEGVNQLGISEVNDGLPYLDSDNQDQYGIITRVFVDRRFTSAETLKAFGQKLLNEAKVPRIAYRVQASELYAITNDPIDRFQTGSLVRVIDEEMGEDVTFRVVNKRKSDVIGAPGNVELEIANRPLDLVDMIANLEQKQFINDVYAQGATNIDSHDFADNCDPEHPAVMKFYIPAEATRINKVLLTYECEPFRAYSKAIEGGGAGVITSNASTGHIDPAEGAFNDNGIIVTGAIHISPSRVEDIIFGSGYFFGDTATTGEHTHGGSVPSDGAHDHSVIVFDHSHDMHYHSHRIDHTHEIELPDHTHEIEYGIYEGPTPTAVTVKVDGNTVSGLGTSAQNVDLVEFLSKDGEGRIQRGTWHTIEIAPNKLGRIVANVVTQIFVQSRGGGSY